MKHTLPITVIMVLIFVASQVIGLYAINLNTTVTHTPEGDVVLEYDDTAIGERPDLYGPETFVYILFAILLGTGLIFLLVKFKKIMIWKAMFFFAIWMTCSITIGVFIEPMYAFIICFFLALFKVVKPNIWIHNATELFIYAGIAIIFVPMLDVLWVVLLLLAISAYDMFAVWKSKHMIGLAEFQTESKAFAGIMLSYKVKATEKIKKIKPRSVAKTAKKTVVSKTQYKNAILGGGDIAFPLIFTGVVMDSLIRFHDIPKLLAFTEVLIITLTVAASLFGLMMLAKKDRFYPAMPFLTAGCLV
ncbi:MAG: hypothetical protein KAS04_04265, partial [Candidatus Aenigmarchaeota archaeon]|nr:hypothetical protein [Candidatus Aenigmarchaeota archaeon]